MRFVAGNNIARTTSFERWCHDHVTYNQWMCQPGGPLSEVAAVQLSNNVVSYAMAWSWDTSKNPSGRTRTCCLTWTPSRCGRAWVHIE